MNGVLQVAAYCSLVVAMSLLCIRLFWPKLAPRVHARRFHHRLGKLDHVLEELRTPGPSAIRQAGAIVQEMIEACPTLG